MKVYSFITAVLLIISFTFTSCLTAKKMDDYVAAQFNNTLPKPDKKSDSSISIKSSIPSDPQRISETKKKSKSVLPLILIWTFDYRHTCTLNPAIGVNNFRKTIYQQANKLKQKLNGQQLELSVDQIPGSFAIVDKGGILLFFIHWDKLYVEPDSKDLIVSYRVLKNGNETKSGTVTVNNLTKNRNIRFAQSWKSSASEFLAQYNADIAEMTKTLINKLVLEL